MDSLGERLNPKKVIILSEKENADDLLSVPGAIVELGEDKHVSYHLSKMVKAEWFVPACSSLSSWAAYLSVGTCFIPNKPIKHFEHKELLPNWRDLEV